MEFLASLPVRERGLKLVGSIYDQIEELEPRAIIAGVTFEQDAFTGRMIPIIELEGVKDIE